MKVGLIGCGSIGKYIAERLDSGEIKAMELAFVYDIEVEKARTLSAGLENKPAVVSDAQSMLSGGVDLVVEAASQQAVRKHVVDILKNGASVVVMSVGAFADDTLFNEAVSATEAGGKLFIPSGAICGLDGVKSSKMGKIEKVELTTTKPLKTLENSQYVIENNIRLKKNEKTIVFDGPAKKAATAFPKSINVSVALSLAGTGLDKTRVRIIADPKTKTNTHEIRLEGAAGTITTKSENTPSPENPKTSYLAALSAIATLKEVSSRMRVGN